MHMTHYVYLLTDVTGEFYYGSRSCECTATDDDYMGSYSTWVPNLPLTKSIIDDSFDTREEAILAESVAIKNNIDNPLNRNYHIPSDGFHTLGKRWKHSEETKRKISNRISGKNNPNYGKRHSQEWKDAQSDRMKKYYKTHSGSNLGRNFNEQWKANISQGRIKLGTSSGKNNPKWLGYVKVVSPDGNVALYETSTIAAETLGVDPAYLRKKCKTNSTYQIGKYKGWKFSYVRK